MANVLSYRPRRSGPRLSPRAVRWLVAVAVLAVLAALACRYTPRLLRHLEQRRLVKAALAAQEVCMRYTLPPSTLAYSEDPKEMASLLAGSTPYVPMKADRHRRGPDTAFLYREMDPPDGAALQIPQWAAFQKASVAGWGWAFLPMEGNPLAFMHSRRNAAGNERLVVMEVCASGILQAYVVTPGTAQSPPRDMRCRAYLIVDRRYSRPLRLFAGQADANDPSHFTLDYLYDGQRGRIDAYLTNSDTIRFSSQSALMSGSGELLLGAVRPLPGPEKPVRTVAAGDAAWRSADHHHLDSMALSPDGRTVAVGGRFAADYAYLWDVKTGKRLGSVPAPAGREPSAESLAFSPDGSLLAIGTYKGVCVWDVAH